jgi:hypothetical protein
MESNWPVVGLPYIFMRVCEESENCGYQGGRYQNIGTIGLFASLVSVCYLNSVLKLYKRFFTSAWKNVSNAWT